MIDTTTCVRIGVLSDDRVYGEGLLRVLNTDSSLSAIGMAGGSNLKSALRASKPHSMVIDSQMSGALDLCAELVDDEQWPVVFVRVPHHEAAVHALLMGARGVVYNTEPPQDVLKAVHLVRTGGVWAPRHVIVSVFNQIKSEASARTAGELLLAQRLSPREREVFQHTAVGLGNKEVAERLSISEATVKVHLTHIFQKLGLRGRGQLAAAYHGILR
jgi:DNA-binding NarL/FixJ family response regulator